MAHPLRDLRHYLRWLQESGRLFQVVDEPLALSPLSNSARPLPETSAAQPSVSTTAPAPVSSAAASIVSPPDAGDPAETLSAIANEAGACRACPLGHSRKKCVPGTGNPKARLIFVGEAPGAREDETGLPFVGPAGKLLTLALEQAGLRRDDVFIANVLKCRPPNNRDPEPAEIEACRPFLHRQIDAISPQYICALGRISAGMLLQRPIAIMRERGTWAEYQNRPLFLSLHPSAVLHNPANRDLFLADIATLVRAVTN